MAVAWPSIESPSSFKETDIQPQHESTSEAGYTTTRNKGTSAKTQFVLGWGMMTSADKATLKTYIETNKGNQITFVHPDTAASHTVLILGDSVEFDFVSPGYWKAELTIKEI